MSENTNPNELEAEIRNLQRRAGITPGSGMVNQSDGCTMNEELSPEVAKEILRRLARHVTPGEWDAVVAERPDWKGALKAKAI